MDDNQLLCSRTRISGVEDINFDDNQLLRSRTRISGVEDINFNRRCLILLRNQSHLTNLIFSRAHEQVRHLGVDSTLNQLRGTFWLIREQETVKTLLSKFFHCNRGQREHFQNTLC